MRSYFFGDGTEVTVTDDDGGKWVTFGVAASEGESAVFMLRASAGKVLEALIGRSSDKKAKRGQNRRD